jgi:hypothetical protein
MSLEVTHDPMTEAQRLGRRDPSLWSAALILVVPAVLIVAMFWAGHVLRASDPTQPSPIHRLGVVHTRFGVADVVCGGNLTHGCHSGEAGLVFREDSPQLDAYFHTGNQQTIAELVKLGGLDRFEAWRAELMRAVAGDPPAGTRWAGFEAGEHQGV